MQKNDKEYSSVGETFIPVYSSYIFNSRATGVFTRTSGINDTNQLFIHVCGLFTYFSTNYFKEKNSG